MTERASLVSQGVEQRLKSLEQQVSSLRHTNRDLERRCFDATQRGQQLASDLGFNNVSEAESAIESNPQLYNRATIEFNASQVANLESELRRVQEAKEEQVKTYQTLLERVSTQGKEIEELKTAESLVRGSAREADSAAFAVKSEELLELQGKYDALLAERNRLFNRHQAALRKFKGVKEWLVEVWPSARRWVLRTPRGKAMMLSLDPESDGKIVNNVCDTPSTTVDAAVAGATETPRTPRKRQGIAHMRTPKRVKNPDALSPLSRDILNTPRSSAASRPGMDVTPVPTKMVYDTLEGRVIARPDFSQTQEDSQALSVIHFLSPKHDNTPTSRKHTAGIDRESNNISPSPIAPKKMQLDSQSAARSPRKTTLPSKRLHHEIDDSQDLLPDVIHPQSSPVRRDRRRSDIPTEKARPTTEGKRPRYSEPLRYKMGRGDNVAGPSSGGITTINAEFEINRDANHGLAFQFDEVVRNKQHRHALAGSECEDCRDYYKAVGPLPPRLQAPAWRTPPRSPVHVHHHPVRAHQQEISRHRAQWARAPTPPGYWNIGFPDTQEQSDINARADQMHRERKEQIAREAGVEGGRYRRRR